VLSDDEYKRTLPSNRRRPVDASGRNWSDSQKLECVTTYLSLGNLALTSRLLKIPEMTIRMWKQKDWWRELETELRQQETLELSVRLKKIIESTLATTEDRLANGDFIYDNRLGQMVRKPVSMRDAHKVTLDLMNRRDVLENRQPKDVSLEQIDDKLAKLAQKFEEIANGRKPIEVTDVIIGSEVSDELEEVDGDQSTPT
jgi:hypothetical protein